jgi:translation elongation factor EF-G
MKQPKHVIAADIFPVSRSDAVVVERIVCDSGCMILRQGTGRATLRTPTELILESLLAQINERVQSPVKAGSCYVLYLETITRSAEAEGKEIDQSKVPSVLADLKKRRTKIEEADASLHEGLVEGFIALAQVLGYHRVLEKMTHARAQLTLHPDHYAPVLEEDSPDFPPAIAIAL